MIRKTNEGHFTQKYHSFFFKKRTQQTHEIQIKRIHLYWPQPLFAQSEMVLKAFFLMRTDTHTKVFSCRSFFGYSEMNIVELFIIMLGMKSFAKWSISGRTDRSDSSRNTVSYVNLSPRLYAIPIVQSVQMGRNDTDFFFW